MTEYPEQGGREDASRREHEAGGEHETGGERETGSECEAHRGHAPRSRDAHGGAPRPAERPIVLMSMRVTEETSYVEPRSALAYDYVSWFETTAPPSGWTVVPIPANTTDVAPYLALPGVALVVLTGGNNVDPALYGGPDRAARVPDSPQAPATSVPQVYPERDRTEFALIDGALAAGIPVWGVCRGLHTINVYFGGRLTQRVEGHVARDHALASDHPLLAGATCNSYHNQAVRGEDIAPSLRVLAHSPGDGLVEALYHPTEPVAAVQWHPERQDRPYDRALLERFLSGELQR